MISTMAIDQAQRRVQAFQQRCGEYGEAALHLAYHAALPVALNAELLHLLRINFFLDPPEILPYTVEFEFLLSPLCREIDEGLYEIEPEIRDVLLAGLSQTYDAQRTRDIATLLWQYVDRHSPWSDRVELERAQQLTALNFLNPEKAQQWLVTVETEVSQGQVAAREWFVAMRQDIENQTQLHQESRTEKLKRLINTADTDDFFELAKIANLNPLKDFSTANLSGLDLGSAQLATANLVATNFSKANLVNANLAEANLINANLAGAFLVNANLNGASLLSADMTGANLVRAQLLSANLTGANLTKANLNHADLRRSILIGCKLDEASLNLASLNHVDLRRSSLTRVDFTGANLYGTNLSNADLRWADLSDVNLVGATFENTLLGGNKGLSRDALLDLKRRGAIVEEDSVEEELYSLTEPEHGGIEPLVEQSEQSPEGSRQLDQQIPIAALRDLANSQVWSLQSAVVRIGRDRGQNDLVLPEMQEGISRQHAEISRRYSVDDATEAIYFLRDSSRLGTWMLAPKSEEWQKIHRQEVILTAGTRLKFGSLQNSILEFFIRDHDGTDIPSYGGTNIHVYGDSNIRAHNYADADIIRLAAFIRNNPNPILVFSPDGEVIKTNPAAVRLLKRLQMEPLAILPKEHPQIVTACLTKQQSEYTVELTVKSTKLIVNSTRMELTYHALPAFKIVYLYIIEITSSGKVAIKNAETSRAKLDNNRPLDQWS